MTLGLAGVIYALIEEPSREWRPLTVAATILGIAFLATFPAVEARMLAPLLPLGLFRSRQFTGANLTTLAVDAAMGGALFLLTLQLQQSLGYSALAAGLATLPTTGRAVRAGGRGAGGNRPGAGATPPPEAPFDGRSSLKVPDTDQNRVWLNGLAHGGYPSGS